MDSISSRHTKKIFGHVFYHLRGKDDRIFPRQFLEFQNEQRPDCSSNALTEVQTALEQTGSLKNQCQLQHDLTSIEAL